MRERGSVSVEVAAVLPLIAVAMLLVAQVGLLVAQQLTVQHAAREGARAAAVHNDDSIARAAALEAGNLDEDQTTVEIAPPERAVGEPVRVTVSARAVLIPVGGLLASREIVLRASVVMRTERAPS